MLNFVGNAKVSLFENGTDTTVSGSKMKSAVLCIGAVRMDCIIRYIAYGSLDRLNEHESVQCGVMAFTLRKNPHTKLGYVNLQITTKPVQLAIYLQVDMIERFFGALAKEGIMRIAE